MKPDLSYEGTSKFITSFGVLLIIGGFSLAIYMLIENMVALTPIGIALSIYSITFLIVGGTLTIIGYYRLEKLEKAEIRHKQEKTIREILEQDYLLAKVKLAYENLNEKIEEKNKELPSNIKKSYGVPRGMESIAKQAFNTEFYQKTYGLGKKKKGFFKRIFKK